MTDLKTISFFKNFDPAFLKVIEGIVDEQTVHVGESLLKQNQINERLFFLISGKLQVWVDDQPVRVSETFGDMFGEMSLISQKPVGASITSLLDSQVISFPIGILAAEIQQQIFAGFSEILVQKLEATNQKAKFFEQTNIELEKTKGELTELNHSLEQKVELRTADLELKRRLLLENNQKLENQNIELSLSQRKFDQLYTDRNLTLDQLEKLYKDHLLPLQFSFDFLKNHTDAEVKDSIIEASKELDQIVHLLEPMNTQISIERTVKSRRVLFAEPNKKQQLVARLALGGTGVRVDVVANFDEAKDLFAQHLYDIVFFHPDCVDVVTRALELNPLVQIVLLTSELIVDLIPQILNYSFSPNIVSRSEENKFFSIKNISTTLMKLASREIFGLDKYLNWGAEVHTRAVTSSGQRSMLQKDVDDYMANLGIRKTIREKSLNVLEELLMNAIYDAPTDSSGKNLYNHHLRTVAIELTPDQQSELSFASDGVVMAISVRDPFGSLSMDVILNYLKSCYEGRAGSLNQHKGGAGRGLHQIIENSDLVVFNIHPRQQTEVIAIFSVDPKEAVAPFASFHLFIAK